MEKTCGTCKHSIDHWIPHKCVCMRCSDSVSLYECDQESCSDYTERTDSVEQVAREMVESFNHGIAYDRPISAEKMKEYLDRLTALGVIV